MEQLPQMEGNFNFTSLESTCALALAAKSESIAAHQMEIADFIEAQEHLLLPNHPAGIYFYPNPRDSPANIRAESPSTDCKSVLHEFIVPAAYKPPGALPAGLYTALRQIPDGRYSADS